MNYTFSLVSDLFSIHPGIKYIDSVKVISMRSRIKQLNVKIIDREFRKQLDATYPGMNDVCPR